jgi:hypothetical protein
MNDCPMVHATNAHLMNGQIFNSDEKLRANMAKTLFKVALEAALQDSIVI